MVSWIVLLLLVVVAFLVSKNIKMIPSGLTNILEMIVEGALSLIDSVTNDRKQSRQFFPWVMTIFLFVVVSNWMGLLPGFGSITLQEGEESIHVFRGATSDLNVTLALAIISVISIQVFGIVTLGFFKYAGKFIVPPWKKPYGIGTFVGFLELISELVKVVSFSFRLFGNIFAGEVLLMVVTYLTKFFVPLPFYFLEIFVGFIQGLVFAMLTLVFMKMAVTSHEEGHEH